MCNCKLCVILIITCSMIIISNSEISREMFVTCINKEERYCNNKKNFQFNNGCQLCKCINNDMKCVIKSCKHFITVEEQNNYCQKIRKENDANYQTFISTQRNIAQVSKEGKTLQRYKRMTTWPKYYGSYWYGSKYRKSIYSKSYKYSTQLKLLNRKKRFQKKMIRILKMKRKKIKKKYKQNKKKYKRLMKKNPYSSKAMLLRYKITKQKSLLKVLKRRLKNYYKKLQKTKSKISKLNKKIQLNVGKKKNKRKFIFKRSKFKKDFLKSLKELYKKHKEKYMKLKKKKRKLVNEIKKEYKKGKKKGTIYIKSKLKKELAKSIKRIKDHMKKIKENYLKTEGENNVLKKKEKKNTVKEKKNVKKKEKKKKIFKDKKDIERKKENKKQIRKIEKDNLNKKIKMKYDKLLKKKNILRKKVKKNENIKVSLKNKRFNIMKIKKEEKQPNRKKKQIEFHNKFIKMKKSEIKIKTYKTNESKKKLIFEKNNNKDFKKVNMNRKININDLYQYILNLLKERKEYSIVNNRTNLILNNKKIRKNMNELKKYFKTHFQSHGSNLDYRFSNKLKEIIPILRKFNPEFHISNYNLLKTYRNNKQFYLTPLEIKYLRMVNDNLYRKYLQLSRLSLLDKRMHRRLIVRNKKMKKNNKIQKYQSKKTFHGSNKKFKKIKYNTKGVVIINYSFFFTTLIAIIFVLINLW